MRIFAGLNLGLLNSPKIYEFHGFDEMTKADRLKSRPQDIIVKRMIGFRAGADFTFCISNPRIPITVGYEFGRVPYFERVSTKERLTPNRFMLLHIGIGFADKL